jgi:hypothetical protein
VPIEDRTHAMVATRRLAAAAAVLPLLLWPDQTMRIHMLLLLLQALKPSCFGWVPTHALLLSCRPCKHIWLVCMLLLGWSLLLLLLLLKLSLCSHTQHCQCIRSSNCVITNASGSC